MSLCGHSEWLLLSARLWLAQRLTQYPGVRLEDKELSLAVHFRSAPDAVLYELRSEVRNIVEMLGPEGLHVVEGSKVLELLPPEIRGKGTSVQVIASGFPRALLPIYIGDDASDESAFSALPSGVTIRVGRGASTAACYTLRDTNEVRTFLGRLEAELP